MDIEVIKSICKEVYGEVKKKMVLLGIPVFILTKAIYSENYNIFILGIPLIRVHMKEKKYYSFHILPLVWIGKGLSKIFTRIKVKLSNKRAREKVIQKYLKPDFRQKCLEKLETGKKLTVVLFESRIACFQYEGLYNLLQNSPYFEPVIVLKPFVSQGKEAMVGLMDEAYSILKRRKYNVIKGYNEKKDTYYDVREHLKPDIVFYSMFWKPHFEERHISIDLKIFTVFYMRMALMLVITRIMNQ